MIPIFLGSLVCGYQLNLQHQKMSESYVNMSFMFKIKIENGKGHFAFPTQLRQELFQNFVRIRGVYSETALSQYIYVLSNLSEHGSHKSVIRNILAVLNFPSNKLYQANADPIKAAINVIPSQMTFFISDDSFERVKGFQGWIIVEVIGERKKNIE